jgi:tRNA(adenine34) deaminase
MFKDEAFKILLKTLKLCPREDFPVASFVNVDGVNFTPFTNQVYQNKNHLNHAEILSINYALNQLNIMDFKNYKATLYTTLEPCCMCLSFAALVRISKIIYYAEDLKFGGISRIFTLNSAFTKPEVLFIEKDEIKTLMNNFFKNKR